MSRTDKSSGRKIHGFLWGVGNREEYKGSKISFWGVENVLIESGNSCTTLNVLKILAVYTLKR